MNIEKNSQELKMYIFTVQGGPVAIKLVEDIKSIMAYDDLAAMDMVRKDYPAGSVINVTKRAEVSIKKILDIVNGQSLPSQELKIETPVQDKTPQSFIHGLMLVADKFVIDKRDKTSLKRIISKIHENQGNPTTVKNPA